LALAGATHSGVFVYGAWYHRNAAAIPAALRFDTGRIQAEFGAGLERSEGPMPAPALRALLGFIAAAISVLTFYQAMAEALHVLALPGLMMPAPYPTEPLVPFGIPRIANDCLLSGLYGIVFGLVWPRLTGPAWLWGLGLGIIAAVIGLAAVPTITHLQPGAGWLSLNQYTTMITMVLTYGLPASVGTSRALIWLRSLLINGLWGIGTAVILSLIIAPGRRRTRSGATGQ
jgi:hypothetical protein